MFSYGSFSDLSICETKIPELTQLCETLVEFGYRTIAVNQVIGEPEFISKKKKKKRKVEGRDDCVIEPIPEPVCLKKLQETFKGKLTILNRLTFEFSDQLLAHEILQSPMTRRYDLLAAIPKTQVAFQHLCSSLHVDIMSFDPANNYPVKLNRKMYNLASRRGIHFEVMYVPAGSGGALRQTVISKAHEYHYFGKSKNMFISSNASFPFQLKGPYDVIHIGLLFGLSEEQSKYAISEAGKKIIRHGICRKLGKCAPILVEKVVLNDDEQDVDSNSQTSKKRRRKS